MASIKSAIVCGVVWGAAGAGVAGTVYGGLLDNAEKNEQRAVEYQQEIDGIEESIDTSYASLSVVEAGLGEACLGVIAPYRHDGVLASISQDVVVDDLLAEPGQPCGETRTSVRENIASITMAEFKIYGGGIGTGLEESLEGARRNLETAKRNTDSPMPWQWIVYVGGASAVFGAAFGSWVGEADKKYRAARQNQSSPTL